MKIAVLGSGSWGTALAKVLAENGQLVRLWGRDVEQVRQINEKHVNAKYLPGIEIPESILATTDLKAAIEDVRIILVVLPTSVIRSSMENINPLLVIGQRPIIVHATKGLEQGSKLRISQVIEEVLDRSLYEALVVLSGPSHAEDVARRDITTVAVASHNLVAAEEVQAAFMNKYFRVYTNNDVIGVEVTIEAKEGKESVSIEKDFYLSKEGNSWKLLYWN